MHTLQSCTLSSYYTHTHTHSRSTMGSARLRMIVLHRSPRCARSCGKGTSPRNSRWYKMSNGDLGSYFTFSISVDIWRNTETVVTAGFKGTGQYHLHFHLKTNRGFCLKITAYNNFFNVTTERTQASKKRTYLCWSSSLVNPECTWAWWCNLQRWLSTEVFPNASSLPRGKTWLVALELWVFPIIVNL